MARYYRRCPNPECPRFKETGKAYQTESKDHVHCPVCNAELPPYDPARAAEDKFDRLVKPPRAVKPTKKEEKTMEKQYKVSPWWIIVAIILVALITWWVVNDQNEKASQAKRIAQLEEIADAIPEPTEEASTETYADTSGKVAEQPYVSHPRRYEETGTGKTKTWKNVVVNDDEYLVVGGVIVNGTKDGVYRGYDPGTYSKITVTDGFIAIVDDDWAGKEFDFRVDQAIKYNWAHAHIDRGPIPETTTK